MRRNTVQEGLGLSSHHHHHQLQQQQPPFESSSSTNSSSNRNSFDPRRNSQQWPAASHSKGSVTHVPINMSSQFQFGGGGGSGARFGGASSSSSRRRSSNRHSSQQQHPSHNFTRELLMHTMVSFHEHGYHDEEDLKDCKQLLANMRRLVAQVTSMPVATYLHSANLGECSAAIQFVISHRDKERLNDVAALLADDSTPPLIQYQCLTAIDMLHDFLGITQISHLKRIIDDYLDSPRMMSVMTFDTMCACDARMLQERLSRMLREPGMGM